MPSDRTDFAYAVTEVKSLSRQVSHIFLAPQEFSTFHYQAGQYIQVRHQHVTSALSIACAPRADGVLEFLLAHSVHNLLAQDLLRIASEEKQWLINGPYGQCTVDKFNLAMPIIFLARGTGIAPIKAMLEAFAMQKRHPHLHLYWFMSAREVFYLKEQIEALAGELSGFTYQLIIASARDQAAIKMGFNKLLADYPDLHGMQVYASGAYDFVHSAFQRLLAYHLQKELFYSDI